MNYILASKQLNPNDIEKHLRVFFIFVFSCNSQLHPHFSTIDNDQDYISLTDMVKNFGDESILYNWLRNRNTIEFLGIWEQLYNSANFKPVEFERFKSQAGLNSFHYSDAFPDWSARCQTVGRETTTIT
ncbi:KilA-N domain-containing protein [Photorhabdus akhurstii]|uniref:KilA-N domain-containing protein n=1 Tax=Photorhabdus akhurstii TaxID=171438 RepID=UPI002F9531A9